jgi:hypothetical protein
MRKLTLFIVAILLASGCATNHKLMSYEDLCKATVENPENHAAWFETIPDTSNILECGLPASGKIKGFCNLMGNIIPENSPFTIWNWLWDPKSNGEKLWASIEGTITGESGDSYFFNGIIVYNVKKDSFFGEMYINGGIGKLDGIIGECYMHGNVKDGVSMWSAQGTLAMRNKQENNEVNSTK